MEDGGDRLCGRQRVDAPLQSAGGRARMIEAKVLAVIAPRIERLKRHQPRACGYDKTHEPILPVLGCMDVLNNAVPDAAVYTCRSDRCEWVRKDPLLPERRQHPRVEVPAGELAATVSQ
jgi:hypothetical protein